MLYKALPSHAPFALHFMRLNLLACFRCVPVVIYYRIATNFPQSILLRGAAVMLCPLSVSLRRTSTFGN